MANGRGSDGPVLGEVLEWSETGQVRARARPPGRRGPPARAEAVAWALFSAGGFVSAILLPVHVAILGIAYGAGWLPARALSYTRIHLLILISLPLYHWAHRFRFAIHHQFGFHWRRLVAAACYGTAVAGTGLTAWVLLRI